MSVKMNIALCFFAFTATYSVREGLGAAMVSPDSGTTIANFEGTLNAATLTCNVTLQDNQISTTWSVGNFRGVEGPQVIDQNLGTELLFAIGGDPDPHNPGLTYLNQLTILNLTSELNGVTVFCGTGGNLQQAQFLLRVYRPPNLMDNFVVRVLDGRRNVPIDLALDPPAFPIPSFFSWMKGGESLTTGPTLTYSTAIFDTVGRQDDGDYVVNAINFIPDNPTQQIGSDTGSFTLDVIYAPTFATEGPRQRYVLLNDSLSLVCGTGLDSNPQADVTWMAPGETTAIVDNARYDLENGPEIVRLNFTRTILSDSGIWRCRVFTESDQYVVSGGQLIQQDSDIIGEVIVDIQLTIVSRPGQPRTLSVDDVQATSIRICWEAPLTFESPISYYLISATNLNDTTAEVLIRNTTSNSTFFSVTGLLPGTIYELTVVAVSQGGDVVAESQASEPEIRTTGLTVPSFLCNDPEFSMGGITAGWSYIHTGGQDLTSVLVSYTFEEGGLDSTPVSVMNTDPTITSINVPRLIAGTRYTFNITALNSIGSSYILCGPTLLSIGIPLTPSIGNLFAGSIATEIKLEIKTLASGEGSGFRFNIIPVRSGMEEPRQMFMNDTYRSGEFVTLTIGDLTEGGTYLFSATAENNYGESGIFNSLSIIIGDLPPPSVSPPPPTQEEQGSGNVGAIIGGVVGVLLLVVIIVMVIVIVAISLHLHYNKGHSKHASNVKIESPIYDEPDIFQRNTANPSDIELKDCPAYEKVQKETHFELEQCPAYGELRSRS